jgi:hypothetical protein
MHASIAEVPTDIKVTLNISLWASFPKATGLDFFLFLLQDTYILEAVTSTILAIAFC